MSLIDEALKRAQAAQNDPARGGLPAHAPLPLPDRSRAQSRQAVRTLFLVLLPAVLLAGVVAVLARRSDEAAQDRERAAAAAPTAPPTVHLPETEAPERDPAGSLAAPAPIDADLTWQAPSRAHRDPTPRDVFEEPVAAPRPPTRDPVSIVPVEAAAPMVASASPMIVQSEQPRRPAARGKPVVRETVLASGARIVLDGIVFSEESPAAVINGRVVSAGSFVDGVEVVRIRQDRVELKDGATIIVVLLK